MTGSLDSPTTRSRGLSGNLDFGRLWVGEAVSTLGSSMSSITVLLLAVSLTGSPAQAATVGSLGALGRLLFRIPGGAIADRYDRKRVLMTANLLSLCAAGWTAVALVAGVLDITQLTVTAFVLGAASSVFDPAEQAALKEIVPGHQLAVALSRNQARGQAASLVGPPLGGLLYGVHRTLPFIADAVSFAVSTVLIWRIRTPLAVPRTKPVDAARHRLLADMLAGLRLVWSNSFMRAATAYSILGNLAGQMLFTVLVLSLAEADAAPMAIGTLQTAAAVSGLTGALVAPSLLKRVPHGRLAICAGLLGALAVAGMTVNASIVWLGLMLAVALILAPAGNSAVMARLFQMTPSELQGRASASLGLGASLGTPIAPLLGGLVLSAYGPNLAFVCVSVAFGLSVAPLLMCREARGMRTAHTRSDLGVE